MEAHTSSGDELRKRLSVAGEQSAHEVSDALHSVRHKREDRSAETDASDAVKDLAHVSLLTKPLTTLFVFAIVVRDWLHGIVKFLAENPKRVGQGLLAIALVLVPILFPPAEYEATRDDVVLNGIYIGYWVLLGIMSSVGLGSGLHTFLLFLGPHIIRVTLNAAKCNSVDFDVNIRQYFWSIEYTADSFQCPDVGTGADATTLEIIGKVRWTAFLWGAGTAIGELPPYFMARAAARAGKKMAELREVEEEEDVPSSELPLAERAKVLVHEAVRRGGFTAILLAASIPNPLFDLAGITCGHFQVPFWTFFGATFIGKAVVKTSLQSLFYVTVAHPDTLAVIKGIIPAALSFVSDKLDTVFHSLSKSCYTSYDTTTEDGLAKCNNCCANLFQRDNNAREYCAAECPKEHEEGEWLGFLWNLFIGGMCVWFLMSIIDGVVHERLLNDARALIEESRDEDAADADAKAGNRRRATSRGRSPAPSSSPAGRRRGSSTSSTGSSKGKGKAKAKRSTPARSRSKTPSRSTAKSASKGRQRTARRGASPRR